MTDNNIQLEVSNISKIVGTSITLNNDGLRLKQYQTDNWEALLTSTALSFQSYQNGTPVIAAKFGADGAYADK